MKINKIMKQYYAFKINEHPFPEKMPDTFREQFKNRKLSYNGSGLILLKNVVFHALLILATVLILYFNTGTIKSLEKIDPDNTRIERVMQTANNFIAGIQKYFYPSPLPKDKGGKQ